MLITRALCSPLALSRVSIARFDVGVQSTSGVGVRFANSRIGLHRLWLLNRRRPRAILRSRRRRRIVAAGMKRVTPTQALDRKQASAKGTVIGKTLGGVPRAGRLKAANVTDRQPDKLRKRQLVDADQCDEKACHHALELLRQRKAACIAACRSLCVMRCAPCRPRACAFAAARARSSVRPAGTFVRFFVGLSRLGCSIARVWPSQNRFGPARKQRLDGQHFGGQRFLGQRLRIRPDDNHHIDSGWEKAGMKAKDFAHQAFAAISLNGAPDFAGCDNAKARWKGGFGRSSPAL